MSNSVTAWTAACFPVLHYLPEFAQTHVQLVGYAMQPSHPLLPPSNTVLNFPSIKIFSNELALHIWWSKYWSFSFSISPSSEYSGFISHRIDWFDLLAVQGTLKSLFQHHSLKALIWHSAFFMIQLSHPFITIGKSHSSDGKVSVYNAGSPGSIPGLGRSPGEGNGNPLQYYCLEKSHGQRSLVGYSPWGRKESDTTEPLHFPLSFPFPR